MFEWLQAGDRFECEYGRFHVRAWRGDHWWIVAWDDAEEHPLRNPRCTTWERARPILEIIVKTHLQYTLQDPGPLPGWPPLVRAP